MAYTITSALKTMSISGSDAVFYATAHGPGGYLYVTYTKGDETSTELTISYQNKTLDGTTYFSHVTSYAGTLIATTYSLTSTGNYRIPFTFGTNERRMKVSFSNTGGTPTGTINIEVTDGD